MPRRTFTHILAEFLLGGSRIPIYLLFGFMLLCICTLPSLEIQAGLDPLVDKSSTSREVLDRVNEHFVNDDILFIVYKTDDVFSTGCLESVRDLGNRLFEIMVRGEGGERTFAVEEVTSLATVKDLVGSKMSFRTEPLVPDPVPSDPDILASIRRRAFRNPVIHGSLLSEDSHVAALVVRLHDGLTDDQNASVVESIRAVLRDLQEMDGATQYFLTGDSVVSADAARYQAEDLGVFLPIGYVLITLLLIVFLRKALGVILALSIATLCMASATALLPLIGSSINNCSSMIPPLMLSLCVAMVLHYFSELGKHSRHEKGMNSRHRTFRGLLSPVFMAALTTGVGFASLSVSGIPAVRDFGIAASGGILVTFAVTTCAVALSTRRFRTEAIIAPSSMASSRSFNRALTHTANYMIAHHRIILVLSLLYTVWCCLGISRISVDMNQIEAFDEDAPVRRATKFMEDNLSGSTVFIASIRSEHEEHFIDPSALYKIEGLTGFLKSSLEADRVTSVVDYVKLMHREFHDGDAGRMRVPDSPEQVAQLLLLGGDERMGEFIDEGRRWVRIVARNRAHSTSLVEEMHERLDEYLQENFPAGAGYETHATGESRLSADTMNRLIRSQSISIALSCIIIFGIIVMLFRSLAVGAICLIPNLVPIVTCLGMMGWFNIPLDAGTVLTSTVALGIAVDDTIHFVQYLRRRLHEHGDLERGIRETFQTKGPAIVWTSVVICLGFSVVLASSFSPTRHFGLLIGLAMIAALIGDLVMLPSIVLWTRSRLGIKRSGK